MLYKGGIKFTIPLGLQKSHIRETLTLSMCADSSTHTVKCPFNTFSTFFVMLLASFLAFSAFGAFFFYFLVSTNIPLHVSCVMCHVSYFMRHVSSVIRHPSPVTCHMSPVTVIGTYRLTRLRGPSQ